MRLLLRRSRRVESTCPLRCPRPLVIEAEIGGRGSRDQARPTGERQILDSPLDDDDAALELDEAREVDEGPHDPGEQARQVHAEHVRDGRPPADHREAALVERLERPERRLPAQLAHDIVRRAASSPRPERPASTGTTLVIESRSTRRGASSTTEMRWPSRSGGYGLGRIGRLVLETLEASSAERSTSWASSTSRPMPATSLTDEVRLGARSSEPALSRKESDPSAKHNDILVVGGDEVKCIPAAKDPSQLPWKELGAEYVIESADRPRDPALPDPLGRDHACPKLADDHAGRPDHVLCEPRAGDPTAAPASTWYGRSLRARRGRQRCLRRLARALPTLGEPCLMRGRTATARTTSPFATKTLPHSPRALRELHQMHAEF